VPEFSLFCRSWHGWSVETVPNQQFFGCSFLDLMSTVLIVTHLHAVGHMQTLWTLLQQFFSCHGFAVQLVDNFLCSVFEMVLQCCMCLAMLYVS